MTNLSTVQERTRPAAGVRGLTKTYGEGDTAVNALRGVDVDIPQGKFTAIMGPSGSGKSTLMHCMAGLDQPTSGSVFLGDMWLDGLSDQALTALRRERMGFIFQAFNLLPVLTARANILLPLTLDGLEPDQRWFDELTATLGVADRLDHRPHELSGGQQQRVAIARALLSCPAVVFADEPTGNLDSHSARQVLELLAHSSRRNGQTTVMVTHDPVAAAHCDQVLIMSDGRVVNSMVAPTVDAVGAMMTSLQTSTPSSVIGARS